MIIAHDFAKRDNPVLFSDEAGTITVMDLERTRLALKELDCHRTVELVAPFPNVYGFKVTNVPPMPEIEILKPRNRHERRKMAKTGER